MLNRVIIDDTVSKEDNIASILNLSKSVCFKVFKNNPDTSLQTYTYDYSMPAHELGLDVGLIVQLIDDYISQIFKSYTTFHEAVQNLKDADGSEKEEMKNNLKNLAHKNLGVARNLRIKDAQVLLNDLMNKHDDIDYLVECVQGLMACAYKLNPSYAYDVLKLNEVKKSL